MINKVKGYLERKKREKRIIEVQGKADLSNITIFSQNCIGGVFYHDLNSKFLSPTINTFMLPKDFLKFVNNYEHYLSIAPTMEMKDYPVGTIDDIKVYFMHYTSCKDALQKWETRKTRINKNKIFVVCCDRDGFSDNDYANFKNLKYPKILYTNRNKWGNKADCLYMEKYKDEKAVPSTIIDNREMYDDFRIIKMINQLK